jgi:hypothetical protein
MKQPVASNGASEDMDEIGRRIFCKVRRRLVEETMKEIGDTDRFDRVLALWIDFQRATQFKCPDRKKEAWTLSPGEQVRQTWGALTDPLNVLALESLFYQLPEGPQREMARNAVQASKHRGHEIQTAENVNRQPQRKIAEPERSEIKL